MQMQPQQQYAYPAAPYGQPAFLPQLRKVVGLLDDGGFELARPIALQQQDQAGGDVAEVSAALGSRLGLGSNAIRALDDVYERWDGHGLARQDRVGGASARPEKLSTSP